MGQVSTEQTVEIIEAVAEVIRAEPTMQAQPNMTFWPLLALGVIPVWLAWWLNRKKNRKKNEKS